MLVGHYIDIPRHVIGQNIHVRFFNFQCEMKIKMIENDKNHALIFFKMTILVFIKFQCMLVFNSSFDDGLFSESTFSFFMCDKHNVIISIVHNKFFFF